MARKLKRFSVNNLSLAAIICQTLIVVLSFVSITWSNTTSESMYVSSKYGIVFLFFLTTYILLRSGFIFTNDLVTGVLIFAGISFCYGIYDIICLIISGADILANSIFITATYANKNLFASVLLLCFWAIYSGKQKLLRNLLLIVLAAFTILLQSKIVLAAFVVLFVVLFIRHHKSILEKNKQIILISLIFIVMGSFVVVNFSHFGNLSNMHTLETRSSLWDNSMQMILDHPFGVGSGNWQVSFSKYGLTNFDKQDVQNGYTIYHQPHNDFLWMLCELGASGFILYVTTFVLIIIMLIRLVKQSYPGAFVLLLNVFAYCLVALFDFPLERIEHQVLLSVILAITLYHYDMISKKNKLFSPSFCIFTCLFLTGFSFIVCFYRLNGEYYTRQFVLLDKLKCSGFVIENCTKARSVFYTLDPMSVPIDWHAGVALFGQGNVEEAKLRLEQARMLAPYNIFVLTHLGNVYEKLKEKEKAAQCYSLALKISPYAKVPPLK